MSDTELRFNAFQVRSLDEEERVIEGRATPYNTWTPIRNTFLEAIRPGTFKRSIDRRGASIPLLWNHDQAAPVGKALEWRDEPDGLYGVWQMDTRGKGAELYDQVREGFVTGLSIGFSPIKNDHDRVQEDPPRITRVEARLGEVSLVTVPAAEEAQVLHVRTRGLEVPAPRLAAARRYYETKFANL